MAKAMKVLMAKRSEPLIVFIRGFESTPRVANSTLEIEAGGYEITLKRSKNHSGVGLLWTPKKQAP